MTEWLLDIPPYQVQLEALKYSQGRKHFAFFMEMGLGKTALILAEYAALVQQGLVDHLLVVCPNSLKGVWLDEMEKVGFPKSIEGAAWPNNFVHHTANRVMVMNYEACITNAGTNFIMKGLSQSRTMLVIDESTQVKNPQARRTRVLINACKNAAYVRLLSGQPIVQGPHDLWSQLRCLGQFSGLNYYAYRNLFCTMGGFMGKQVMGAKDPAALNEILRLISFRAKKDDWLDLPKQIYTTRNIVMSREQQKHYDLMKKYLITKIAEKEIDAQMVITQMLKLQQISSGFIIDETHKVHAIPGGNPKINALDEIMEEATGKVLIFTHFRESTRLVMEHLEKYTPMTIQGNMWPEELDNSKRVFETLSACRVMVCQVQSAKYGLTLLGGPGEDRCATTVFYENSFSLDSRIQAEARNHRIGQDRSVVYIDLPASDIERVVVKALRKKQDVATAIVDYVATV